MQVDVLSSQVSALGDEAKNVEQLEKSLKQVQDEKLDLNQKLFAAINENSSIQDQVMGPAVAQEVMVELVSLAWPVCLCLPTSNTALSYISYMHRSPPAYLHVNVMFRAEPAIGEVLDDLK